MAVWEVPSLYLVHDWGTEKLGQRSTTVSKSRSWGGAMEQRGVVQSCSRDEALE
jgi:hypothetical protein